MTDEESYDITCREVKQQKQQWDNFKTMFKPKKSSTIAKHEKPHSDCSYLKEAFLNW